MTLAPELDLDNLRSELAACRTEILRLRAKPIGLPANTLVGPYEYTVLAREPDDLETLGLSDHVKLEITIRPNMHPQVEAETFLHEVLHCVYELCGINPKYDQEHIVQRLSPHLLRWMKDNPQAVKGLL